MGVEYIGFQRKTWYGNFLYDSTLEARWAKFFDDVGILFTPHPATFKTGRYFQNGNEIVYTPDFYLRDYGVYCEVKPSDELLAKPSIQQKISAAMDNNCTSVGNGLLILGPISGFFSDERQKFVISGDFYKWFSGSIVKSEWMIGKSDDGEAKTCLFKSQPEWGNDEIYSQYPFLSRHPSVSIKHSSDDIHASPAVYSAIFSAIYADKNGFFRSDENDFPDIPDIPDKDDEALPFK